MFIQVIVLYPGRWLFHKWKAKKKKMFTLVHSDSTANFLQIN